MFLKDHLIDTYQKASLEKNNSILEHVINRWAHRFGIETINELVVKNQDQINLLEKDQEEENQDQINLLGKDQEEENQDQISLALLEKVQLRKEVNFKSKQEKITYDNQKVNKNINESYKYFEKEELPLPNINNLRKWIKNEKKAS